MRLDLGLNIPAAFGRRELEEGEVLLAETGERARPTSSRYSRNCPRRKLDTGSRAWPETSFAQR
jgi:hypothetical protein